MNSSRDPCREWRTKKQMEQNRRGAREPKNIIHNVTGSIHRYQCRYRDEKL